MKKFFHGTNMLKKTINGLPLRTKISCIIVPLALLFAGAFSLVGVQVVVRASNRQIYQTLAASLDYAAVELMNNLHAAKRISTALVSDEVLQHQLSALKTDPSDRKIRTEAFRSVNALIQSYQVQFPLGDVEFISVDADTMHFSTNTARERKIELAVEAVCTQARMKEGRLCWKIEGDYLLLSRMIRKAEPLTLEPIGTLTIALDLERIVGRCTNFYDKFEDSTYIILDNQEVVYHTKGIDEEQIEKLTNGKNEYGVIQKEGKRFFAVRGSIDKDQAQENGYEYIALVSYDIPYEAIRTSRIICGVMILAGLGMAFVLSNCLMLQQTRHIDKLVLKMKSFGRDHTRLEDQYDYSSRDDEIGQLHQQFEIMADQIDRLIQNDYQNKLLMKEAQLKALQKQIDPHFLYNVLASVNWRAKAIGEECISQMVDSLSKLLRATLNNHDENFTLRKEMELVKNYTTIQQLRFEDQLEIETEIPNEVLDAALPKLTIQPLVENAIRYAMQDGTDVCRIRIEVTREKDNLSIRVMNTGSSFEENLLQKLEENKIEVKGFGIGILNIHKRLQYTFGEGYGLSFENKEEKAIVAMTIPYRPVKEETSRFSM